MAQKKTLAVIGGGSCGLFIAAMLADTDIAVRIFERNQRCGKKLLTTGNGRCNLSNVKADPSFYSDEGRAQTILEAAPPQQTLAFFRKCGLLTTEGSEGRIYPVSNAAGSVVDVLRNANSAVERNSYEIVSVEKKGNRFSLCSAGGLREEADAVAITTGSPASVADSKLPLIARSLGLPFIPFRPVLCPLAAKENTAMLSGQRVRTVITAVDGGIPSIAGEVQFKDGALGGICIFELSFFMVKNGRQTVDITLDLLPDLSETELLHFLIERQQDIDHLLPAPELLTGIFVRRINEYIFKTAEVAKDAAPHRLQQHQLQKIVSLCKRLPFTLSLPAGLSQAQAAAGGIPLSAVDLSCMQARDVRGVFLAGEVLDLYGQCGGYNLQLCWSQAMLAAKGIINYLMPA